MRFFGKVTFLTLVAIISNLSEITAQDHVGSTPEYDPIEITSTPDVILTQHWAMPTLLNPAATGNIDFIRIRGGARIDYLGSADSPKNYLAVADSPFKLLGKRIGAGILVNSQTYDLFQNLQVGAQGSYKLKIKNSSLSIGIQLGYYHSKFKGSKLKIKHDNMDPGENEGTENEEGEPGSEEDSGTSGEDKKDGYYNDFPTHDIAGGAFDMGVGVRYEHPKFNVGISVMHLMNSKVKLKKDGESATDLQSVESKLPMTLYFDAGGNIDINNSLFTLQPSLLIGTDFSDFTGVVNMRATYNHKITFGLNYRYNRAAGVMAGLSIKNFYIGYNWEYDYKMNPKGSTGNHELVLGFQFKMDMSGKSNFSHRSIRIM